MIIGHGDIASVLNDRDGFIFFASGVSNSLCIDASQFTREYDLLFRQPKDKTLVYFSTIAINFFDTQYTWHKRIAENLIKQRFQNYHIIRLGNISWGTNPNTFINFIRNKKAKGEPVEIRDEYRYMISKEQLLFITDNLPLIGQNEISVFGEAKKVKDLVWPK